MSLWILPKERATTFAGQLMADYEVVGPVAKGDAFSFAVLYRPEELRLDYPITQQSPKGYLLPPEETLLHFKQSQPPEIEMMHQDRRRVLFGVHPCDINATWLLDLAFSQDALDTPYMERRERTLIVGLDCLSPCDSYSFCKSMGSLEVTGGYDLFMTDLGDRYVVETGTEAGQALVEKYAEARPVTDEEIASRWKSRPNWPRLYRRPMTTRSGKSWRKSA
jgi:sulfhydrogenase subunit beta (sulfur reductase)